MKRIFIDANKCDGCLNCNIACMNAHRKEQGTVYDMDLSDLDNETRNFIQLDSDGNYKPIFCRHCNVPECAGSCMSGALNKNMENGLVEYDANKCGSCFMCVMNCPYGVLKPDYKTKTKVIKCDFCKDKNEKPSCVDACPKEAIYVLEV